MRWDFHGIAIGGTTNDATLRQRWATSFASRPGTNADPDVTIHLELVDAVPAAPAGEPQFRQGALLAYYLDGDRVTAHFPRYGQLRLDLGTGTTDGKIVPAGVHTYGVLEDLIAIGLSPHLRRRGQFLIHAFAAAHAGRAVLLVGDIGAGKTTTGMALLDAGWRLLSNDSPIIDENGHALSYPGVLTAYPDTLARFAATAHLAEGKDPAQKVIVAAEAIWPEVWIERAPVGAICFPQIDPAGHALAPLSRPETLRRLLPHAVEQWDRAMIPAHLAALRRLADTAPGYDLRLGPDVSTLPSLLTNILHEGHEVH